MDRLAPTPGPAPRPRLPPGSISNPGTAAAARLFGGNPVYAPPIGQFSPSHGLGVTNEAVDYFTMQTRGTKSMHAAINLSIVTSGRIIIALGLAAVYNGLGPEATWQLGVGVTGLVVGSLLAAYGAGRFYQDTRQFNQRRANVAVFASGVGIGLATGGGALYTWAHASDNRPALYASVVVRTAGSILLFGTMPTGYSASEIVWGDTPVKNRVALRDTAYAHGAGLLMAWAHLSSPDPPAPLWSREAMQCIGIAAVALGASLARTDLSREQAAQQTAIKERRTSTVAAGGV